MFAPSKLPVASKATGNSMNDIRLRGIQQTTSTEDATGRDTRICIDCSSIKPLSEFRRRSRNRPDRLNQCRDCHNRAERQRRAALRASDKQLNMARSLTELKNEADNRRLELLIKQMLDHFGGLPGFISAWEIYLDQAMKDGGLSAFRCFASMIRLLQYCEESQRSRKKS